MVSEDPQTRELRIQQGAREAREAGEAESAPEPAERLSHQRRAEQAAYLRDKLAERAQSERGDES